MKKFLLFFFIFFSSISPAFSGIIRDSEIENFIKKIFSPIVKTTNQKAENLNINIINDNKINAFVTPGQKIFIFTGLLLNSTSPNQIEGVLAHELGHITGKHHLKIYEQLERARIINIVGMILGGAATLATGDPEALVAATAATTGTTQRSLLSFSRIQEGAADQAGFTSLKKSNKSVCGILHFLKFMESREGLGIQNEYTRSHPLTKERINDANNAAKNEDCSKIQNSKKEEDEFLFIQAKLHGFIDPTNTLKKIKNFERFNDDHKNYALSIANYKLSNFKKGNELIDKIIKKYPMNPYFYELKAQMLRENGYLNESLKYYKKTIKLIPDDSLILIELAQIQINLDSNKHLAESIKNLNKASRKETQNQKLWYLLSVAYGRDGMIGKSRYASAHAAYYRGDDIAARNFIKMAKKIIKKNSREWKELENLEKDLKIKNKK